MATYSSTGLDCEGFAGIFKPFHKSLVLFCAMGFPGGTSGKESTCQCRRHRVVGSIPGLGRSPRAGNGNLLQYSCLEDSMDRGVHSKESDTTEQLTLSLSLSRLFLGAQLTLSQTCMFFPFLANAFALL